MSERESKTSGPDPGTETGAREGASEKAEERVRESFARQGLMGLLGAQIVRVGHGTCEIEVPFRDEITQQQRYFHGAVAGAHRRQCRRLRRPDPGAAGQGGAHGRIQGQLPCSGMG
jgi:hypothetical protein